MIKTDEKLLFYILKKFGPDRHPRAPSFLDIAESLGIPYKRARYIALKWTDKNWYNYGVSWRVGWLENKIWESK